MHKHPCKAWPNFSHSYHFRMIFRFASAKIIYLYIPSPRVYYKQNMEKLGDIFFLPIFVCTATSNSQKMKHTQKKTRRVFIINIPGILSHLHKRP